MNLDELLGIDPDDPEQMLADRLVEADDRLLDGLIERRHHLRLSIGEVAERVGVSESTIAGLEGGDRDPRLSLLRLYALAVHVEVDHVVTGVDHVVTSFRHFDATKQRVNAALIEQARSNATLFEEASWRSVLDVFRGTNQTESSPSVVAWVVHGQHHGQTHGQDHFAGGGHHG